MKNKVLFYGIFIPLIIFLSTIMPPVSDFVGIKLIPNKDFSCCKNHKLVLHHFYKLNFFWICISDGYIEEEIGLSQTDVCNIICAN